MRLTLQRIFIAQPDKRLYSKQELFDLKLHADFLNEMADRLELNYDESESTASSVCFANSKEVRPEFRTIFSRKDIIQYVVACLKKNCFELDSDEIPFPMNVSAFWLAVIVK